MDLASRRTVDWSISDPDGKGNCWDDSAMESFFKTLKVE